MIMGKRSNFERNPRDFYATPYSAVLSLLPHLPLQTKFIEPCAGDGRLVRHIESSGGHKCVYACDIEPQAPGIDTQDVLLSAFKLPPCQMVITNPVWRRPALHAMIEKFRKHAPTWLLIDAGWMFTKQAKEHLPFCSKIVTVGRVIWIEGTKQSGMEDCAWYQFGKEEAQTIFIGKK